MNKIILTTVILFLGAVNLWSQNITTFSEDPDKFVGELEKLLKNTKREDCQETADDLIKTVKNGELRGDALKKVQETAQMMLDRKLRAFPYFEGYIRTILNFENSGKDEAFLVHWHDVLNKVTVSQRKGDNKKFKAFIDFSRDLFNDNALYASKAKTWVAASRNFVLKYEDENPLLEFPSTKLFGYTKGDTIVVHNTSGVFYPFDNRWVGDRGRANWYRAGLDTSKVYCTFDKYEIDLTSLEFKVDTVEFYFDEFFKKPIYGSFVNKLVVDNKRSTTSYPRFESFEYNLEIQQISKNLSYEGGFNLFGTKIYGTGSDDQKAKLIFYDDGGNKLLQVKSSQITIRKPIELYADQAEVSLYFKKDSIYHPGLKVNYKIKENQIRLFRGEQGISKSGFYNSYHQQEIEADAIFWNLDEKVIDVKMIEGAGQKPAVFQSKDFFDAQKMVSYQGVVEYDPLSVIKKYHESAGSREIDAELLAQKFNARLSESQIKGLLYELVEDGFIFYDEKRSLVTVKDKLINYVLANAKKIDYDNIRVEALSRDVNGKINLENYDIDLQGVSSIPISDTAFVYFFPKGKEVTLKKNRDIEFSGTIFAGRMDMFGEGYYFNYEPFNVDLAVVDSMIINIPDGDKLDQHGDPVLRPINSNIEKMTGLLEIDAPINKSGRANLPQFPIFESKEPAYIYYYDRNALGNVYPKNDFFFKADPFKRDSMRTFNPASLAFTGALTSAGIFPEIKETATLQRDLSLGFITKTPPEGLPVFGEKGDYTGSIRLNNFGLRGQGNVAYLTSNFNSGDIIFFPDSLNSNADDFFMAKSTGSPQFPEARGINNYIHWEPYQDKMWVYMKDTAFDMYENQTVLEGNLLVSATGLTGNGALDWDEAVLSSQLFEFRADDLAADTASLKIKSIGGDKVTFNTPNVSAKVDFKTRFGQFASNSKELDTEFAYNQYKTAINEFDWDMDAKILNFRSPPEGEGAYFVSTHPDQNELKFRSKIAEYNLTTSIISAEQVPEVRVADASVIPYEGKVVIEPEAVMRTLENAIIESDTINAYHRIHSATVDITSKNVLSGKGSYTYKAKNLPEQQIAFSEIGVKKETIGEKKDAIDHYRLIAAGSILEDQNFSLYPNFAYQGNVDLTSINEFLHFQGFSKMNLKSKGLQSLWFEIDDDFDPNNLLINFNEPKSIEGIPLMTGICLSKRDTSGMYTVIMDGKRTRSDVPVIETSGIIKYNEATNTYTFGNEAKINGESTQGNYLTLDDNRGKVYAEGLIDLGLDFGAVEMVTSGNMKADLNKKTYAFDLTMGLNIEFSKDLNELFSFYMFEDNLDNPDLDYEMQDFRNQLTELVEDKKETKIFEEMATTGIFTKPKDLFHNLYFTDLDLEFNALDQVYRSNGQIGLMFVGEKSIHKQVEGFIEYGYRRSGDYFNMFFKSSLNDWFFLTYKSNSIQVISSYEDFNEMLRGIESDKRKVKRDDGSYYIYSYGSKSKMKSFVDRMKSYN